MRKEEAEQILNDNDPIGDLRRKLNKEMITKEQFHKMTSVLKVMPEFLKIAKKNFNN
jgi:TPP-dependent pyruvate/acetoin dehydrogenase alpha subunit